MIAKRKAMDENKIEHIFEVYQHELERKLFFTLNVDGQCAGASINGLEIFEMIDNTIKVNNWKKVVF